MTVTADRLSSQFLNEHPLRPELHNELHARPSLYFEGDSDVWHVAILGVDGPPAVPAAFFELSDLASTQDGRHGIGAVPGGRLKWELHTEFLTLTFVAPAASASLLRKEFEQLSGLISGQCIAAVHVAVRGEATAEGLLKPETDYVASLVGGGDAEVRSNFRLNADGFVELTLLNRGLNAYRTGRMVRRLLEIETYRMMALLSAPLAKETASKLADFDHRLSLLIAHMQKSTKVDKALLSEVTKLSSDVLTFSAKARHRFGATRAYAQLVASRFTELREGRVDQRQRIGTFIDRRFQPAIHSFEAAERRLDDLAQRVSLAGDLLRTTVQVQLEDQNASLLSSVEERTRAQVHIQQAVEGFSIIAISYYAISLAKLCAEGAAEFGIDKSILKISLLAIIPVTVFVIWRTVRHIRRAITNQEALGLPTKDEAH